MEFESLSSSKKAVSELSRRLGLQKVSPRADKSKSQVIVISLSRATKMADRVLKNLKYVIDDPETISDYVASAARFKAISDKIINKIGGNLDVKEDIETP